MFVDIGILGCCWLAFMGLCLLWGAVVIAIEASKAIHRREQEELDKEAECWQDTEIWDD